MSLSKRIPVCPTEIKAGIPFPWAVYDVGGMLLLNAGMAPSTPAQAQALIARGLYRERTGALDAVPEKPSTAPPAPELARGAPAPVKGDPLPFDTLALRPGELLQVHSALEVASDFLPVALIGYLKDQTLITTHPRVGGRPMHLAEGALLNIKAFSGTNLFNFKTKVLRAYPEPTPHLHLAYPKCVYVTRVRTALRAVVDLPADLRDRVTGATTPVVLKDLSVGGARLLLPSPTGTLGARYELAFKVKVADDLEATVATEVVVRSLDSPIVKGVVTHTLGVQFQDLPREARLLIMTLVYRQQLQRGAAG